MDEQSRAGQTETPRSPEISEKLTKVTVQESKAETLKRSVDALINDRGDFVLDGYDYGRFVEDHMSGGDYEYSITVERDWKDTLLLLLIKNQFADFPEFERWIKAQGIPHQQFRWS